MWIRILGTSVIVGMELNQWCRMVTRHVSISTSVLSSIVKAVPVLINLVDLSADVLLDSIQLKVD